MLRVSGRTEDEYRLAAGREAGPELLTQEQRDALRNLFPGGSLPQSAFDAIEDARWAYSRALLLDADALNRTLSKKPDRRYIERIRRSAARVYVRLHEYLEEVAELESVLREAVPGPEMFFSTPLLDADLRILVELQQLAGSTNREPGLLISRRSWLVAELLIDEARTSRSTIRSVRSRADQLAAAATKDLSDPDESPGEPRRRTREISLSLLALRLAPIWQHVTGKRPTIVQPKAKDFLRPPGQPAPPPDGQFAHLVRAVAHTVDPSVPTSNGGRRPIERALKLYKEATSSLGNTKIDS